MQVQIQFNFLSFSDLCCFTSTNFGLKVRIFLIIKRLKVSFRVDISKILAHAVIPHDSVMHFITEVHMNKSENFRLKGS